MIFQGTQTSIAKKPYNFVNFQGGGSDPLSPPLDPGMVNVYLLQCYCAKLTTMLRLNSLTYYLVPSINLSNDNV